MAALSVKVPREKLIGALNASLEAEKKNADQAAFDAENAEYQKTVDAWGKKVAQAIVKAPSVSSSDFWRGNELVMFNIKGLGFEDGPPKRPASKFKRQDQSKIRELENAIKILSLSEEEFVNASTYKSVVQYL